MMRKDKLLSGLLLSGILTILLTGCGGGSNESTENNGNADGAQSGESTITWAMPKAQYELSDLSENVSYLNKVLAEDGYPYQLSVLPLEPASYDAIVENGGAEGVDILSLGAGAGEGTVSTPQKVLEAGVLCDIKDYLYSAEGSGLYNAFYEKLWEGVTIDGKVCVIPNQLGQDGTAYAAFRRDIFGDEVPWDGTVKGIFELAEQAEIPEDMLPVLWGASLLDISVSLGYEYYDGLFVSLEDGSCHFPYQTEILLDTYGLMNEWHRSGRLQQRLYDKAFIAQKNYAIWVNWEWNAPREEVAEEYVFLQFPYTFGARINGGIGICESGSHREAALKLLTLLFTEERYANAMMWGEPGVKYKLTDGFAEYLVPGEEGPVFTTTIITGIYDLVYPRKSDDFPVNRKDTKWSLYGTEAEKESRMIGLVPDISAIQSELTALVALSQEYEHVWQEEDMAAALEEANRRYEELGGDRIAAELERLLNK
ncbi:MAG: hypothetical protein NC517_02795 [Firmicutes bacterium]|nr:hypothetical protein [Bacillota bacterium]